MDTATLAPHDTSVAEIQRIFALQQDNHLNIGGTTAVERKAKLSKLYDAIIAYRPQIKEALYKDYRKHPTETDMTEVYPTTTEIKDAKRNVARWMRPEKVSTPMSLLGTSSYIRYEPKGVVLIIAPWNFPFYLTIGPLVSAIAAGNTIILKPSEMTPHTSALMKKILTELFAENEIAVVEGGVETSKALLDLPFNHIFFTGAPSIGKIVMRAAAEHLCSVTLELGGQSPTIVDETADIDTAARRIAWGKFMNNGQVCIAPDHVFVHASKKEKFLAKVREYLKTFYTKDPASEKSYSRMVNQRHFERVKGYVEDAVLKGAKTEIGGRMNAADNFIEPTVMTNVSPDSALAENEIFGPVLPVYEFTDLQKVIDKINAGEKPLALYIYSKKKRNIQRIINNTRAGGTCINQSTIHSFNTELPFGGSNNSGIGKAHGRFGFEAFSEQRGVLRQYVPNAVDLLMPPYTDFKQKLVDLTIKFF